MWAPEQRRRIFCLYADRGNDTLRMLEALELAGAVDSIDYILAIRELGLHTPTARPDCTGSGR